MTSKINYLDGLRGTAACIVVVAHFFQIFAPSVFEGRPEIEHFAMESWAARTPVNLLFNGNFSVCLFFVLSGFVLSYRYMLTKDRAHLYSSAFRRYFRLSIPAIVSVALAYLAVILHLGYYDDIQSVTLSSMPDPFAADSSFWAMIKQSTFHTFFTYGSTYNPVLWTMTYELFGSFLIFGFLLLLGRSKLRFFVYAALIWFFLDSYYLGFVLGMLLCDLKHHSNRNWLAYVDRTWIHIFMICAGVYLGSYPYLSVEGTIYSVLVWDTSSGFSFFIFYHVIGAFLIIVSLLSSTRLQALFHHKLFRYLGKISFSLYLVHFTILCTLGSYIFSILQKQLSYGLSVALTVLLTTPVIFLAAHFFYRIVDNKTLILLSRLSARLFRSGNKQKEHNVETRRSIDM